jgi:hypothetical protein
MDQYGIGMVCTFVERTQENVEALSLLWPNICVAHPVQKTYHLDFIKPIFSN